MKIVIIVEGATEKAFGPVLQAFLKARLADKMPKIQFKPQAGRVPKEDKLRRLIAGLRRGSDAADYVIALTDVYTGTNDFSDASDAKQKMLLWAGKEHVGKTPVFFAHAAQYDFEAWLLPFWPTIQKLAGHDRAAPHGVPESVNHNKSPAKHIEEIFRIGTCREHYVKARDGRRILEKNDLSIAINACPELKSFVNTIIRLAGGEPIP